MFWHVFTMMTIWGIRWITTWNTSDSPPNATLHATSCCVTRWCRLLFSSGVSSWVELSIVVGCLAVSSTAVPGSSPCLDGITRARLLRPWAGPAYIPACTPSSVTRSVTNRVTTKLWCDRQLSQQILWRDACWRSHVVVYCYILLLGPIITLDYVCVCVCAHARVCQKGTNSK